MTCSNGRSAVMLKRLASPSAGVSASQDSTSWYGASRCDGHVIRTWYSDLEWCLWMPGISISEKGVNKASNNDQGGGNQQDIINMLDGNLRSEHPLFGFCLPVCRWWKILDYLFQISHINSLCFARCTGLGSHPQRQQHTGKPGIVGHAVSIDSAGR